MAKVRESFEKNFERGLNRMRIPKIIWSIGKRLVHDSQRTTLITDELRSTCHLATIRSRRVALTAWQLQCSHIVSNCDVASLPSALLLLWQPPPLLLLPPPPLYHSVRCSNSPINGSAAAASNCICFILGRIDAGGHTKKDCPIAKALCNKCYKMGHNRFVIENHA